MSAARKLRRHGAVAVRVNKLGKLTARVLKATKEAGFASVPDFLDYLAKSKAVGLPVSARHLLLLADVHTWMGANGTAS